MMWAIGLPGQSPRLIMASRPEHVEEQVAQGEIMVEVDGPGDWVISGDGLSVSPRIRSIDEQWMDIRAQRLPRLVSSDWTDHGPMPEAARAAWSAYRQALRDITSVASPAEVVWPTAPDAQASAATVAP
jgi:hypothetical protein